MNERDRLIELIKQSDIICDNCPEYDCSWWAEQCADHLIANGVIVPPIKLGQICYEIDSYRKEIDECRVSSITQKADASLKIRITNMRYKGVYEITADKISKTVFLTREEAEQAMKETEWKNDSF